MRASGKERNSSSLKPSRGRCLTAVLAALVLALPFRAQAAVKVILGFMDDELNEVLQRAMQKDPNATIVAITPPDPKAQLYGRPIPSYVGRGDAKILSNASSASASSGASRSSPAVRLSEALAYLKTDPAFAIEIAKRAAPNTLLRTAT